MKMKKLKWLISALGLGLYAGIAQASVCDSEKLMQQVLQKAGKSQDSEFTDCKVLPHQPQSAVIAVAQGKFDDQQGMGEYNIHLIKVDSKTGAIKTIYTDPTKIISDAITFSGLKLDTAAYQLNSSTRAIGLRFSYTGSSRINPYAPQTITLYDLDRKQKVLSDLLVGLDRGEWDGRCNGEWEEYKITLQMLSSKSHHYADIKVNATVNARETTDVLGGCDDANPKQNKQSFVLKFDGKQYQIPKQYREQFTY